MNGLPCPIPATVRQSKGTRQVVGGKRNRGFNPVGRPYFWVGWTLLICFGQSVGMILRILMLLRELPFVPEVALGACDELVFDPGEIKGADAARRTRNRQAMSAPILWS